MRASLLIFVKDIRMRNIFRDHPNSVNETYIQHLKFASAFGFQLIIGGIGCFIHAVFPFWFQKTGSHVLLKLMHQFIERMPTLDEKVLNLSVLIEEKSKK
jgi:hypothetical protein